MNFKKIIKQIEASSEFKKWKKENSKAYLAHAFVMTDEKGNGEWQIGYYNPGTEMMTTAIINDDKVSLQSCDEVFKQPGAKVVKLKIDDVQVGFDDSKKAAEELRQKEYKRELPTKIIAILQNLAEYGIVWNFTYVTMAMNTLNIKIDASTGEVKHHELHSLMEFRAG